MSTRDKGNRWEKEVKAILESQGYVVERALPKFVYIPGRKFPISQSHDFFGAWDIIAKLSGEKTLWIQVSSWDNASTKRKQVEDFPATEGFDECAIWARVEGRNGHFRIMYRRNGYEWKGDTVMVK
jgi:hypothetical protein